jgi:uncharacterized repeat protein (TIGR01451 family)
MSSHLPRQQASASFLQKEKRSNFYYHYRMAIILGIISHNVFWMPRVVAQTVLAGDAITNQATGSFVDSANGGSKNIESNIVSVTVAEVAGITITAASTPTAIVGSTTNFDFKIQNVGNDPTKFFLPQAPSSISVGSTASPLQIVGYIPAGGTQIVLATPITVTSTTGASTGDLSDPTLGGNTTLGSIPAGAAIVVRFAVSSTATVGSQISVTLGNTTNQPNTSNTPYIVGANGLIGTSNDVYTIDNADVPLVTGEAAGVLVNSQEASAIQTVTVSNPPISVSGTVFRDADADVTINGTDAGTNAASVNLTIYAIDTADKVLAKATVDANGNYTLANVPASASVKLRLSNDATYSIDTTAPTAPSLPSGWFHTGKNLNGTINGTIATLGDIALNTTTTNLTAQNFGIRQSYVLSASPVPTTCSANFTTNLNTGVSASGGKLEVGDNDLNWTAEWLNGPATGTGTPYSQPRPVGILPAVVTGNLAPGAWVDAPTNAEWISYPFRLPSNSNGNHTDADLDGALNETSGSGTNTTDAVRLKFTAKLTLPINASSIAISLPVGVSADNRFVSLKVNGVENLVPTPVQDPYAQDFRVVQSVSIQNGWQPNVNTIEVILDSGPDRVGFFLAVQATTTQVCASNNPNLLLVKRITGINGSTTTSGGGDNLAIYKDETSNPYDDNLINTPAVIPPDTDKWPIANDFPFMIGGTNGGNVKPKDSIDYTIYFLSTGDSAAKSVLFCDRVPANVTFSPNAFTNIAPNPSGVARGIAVSSGDTLNYYSNVGGDDIAQYFPPGIEPSTIYPNISCGKDGANSLPNDNGAVVVNLGNRPQATGTKATDDAAGAYGFVRFRGQVK